MTDTRLRDTTDPQQSPTTGIVPSRMGYLEDWDADGVHLELYLDPRAGDGCIIAATRPEDHVAGIAAGGGVLRHVAWAGRWLERGPVWCEAVRTRAAAVIAGGEGR